MKNVLLIVDIQKLYVENYNIDYLEKIYYFLNSRKFHQIQCLIDINDSFPYGDHIPKFMYDKLTHTPILKEYSDLPTYIANEHNYDDDELKEKLLNNNMYMAIDDGYMFLLNRYELFDKDYLDNYFLEFINKEFKEFLDECKENNYKITLIGGGCTKCVRITEKILETLGIEYRTYKKYCYEVKFVDRDPYCDLFDRCNKSISDYPKKLFDKKGNFKWKKVKIKDNSLVQYR